jgi:hypothetical protein
VIPRRSFALQVIGIIAVYCRCVLLAGTAEKSLSMLPPELTPHVSSTAPVAQAAFALDVGKESRWTSRKGLPTSSAQADAPLELKFTAINKVRVRCITRIYLQ